MKGKKMTDEQLLQAFRKQPDEEMKQSLMIIHSQTTSKLTSLIQQQNLADIIETEQLILSGLNEKLEPQSPQQVLKLVKAAVLQRVKDQ